MQRVTLLDGNTNDALIELTPGQPFVGDRLVQRVAQKYFGGDDLGIDNSGTDSSGTDSTVRLTLLLHCTTANYFNQPTTGNNPSQPPTGTIDGF